MDLKLPNIPPATQANAEGEVNIAQCLPRRSRGKYSAIFPEPGVNNYL